MPHIPLPLIEVPLLALENGAHVARALVFHNRTLVYCPRCSLLTEQSMLRSTCASTNPSVSAWGGGSDGDGRWACNTCLIP